jgi:hypothetical protein
MIPTHFILLNGKHSPKITTLIEEGHLIPGKSYPIDKTPIMYDPQTYQPSHKWMLFFGKTVLIEQEEMEESFTTLQNWRNLQISKLTDELPNQHLIEYINYLNHQLLSIKEELIKNPNKDSDIFEESEIIGKQIASIKEKLYIKTPI